METINRNKAYKLFLINSYAAALSLTYNKQTSKQVNKHVINDESSLEWLAS